MSYVVRKSGSNGFKIQKQIWNNGTKTAPSVPRKIWQELGFSPAMTIEEARLRASQLNEENSVQKLKLVKAARNEQQITYLKSIYLRENYVIEFQDWIKRNFAKKDAYKKMISQWKTAQELINNLKLFPKDFRSNHGQIVNYFAEANYSLDYVQKIIRILNLWSDFVGDKEGIVFKPIPKLTSNQVTTIQDAYLSSEDFRGESDPLTPTGLFKLRQNITEEQFRWLSLTVWFGMRPEEVRMINNPNQKFRPYVKHDSSLNIDVLWVYQGKLTRVAQEKRWKGIPIFLPEQKEAIKYLSSKIKPPLNKTIQKYLGGYITLYGGRKGFVDLMLDRGQSLENISMWLGHQSIEMTWTKYRNKKRVSFNKPA